MVSPLVALAESEQQHHGHHHHSHLSAKLGLNKARIINSDEGSGYNSATFEGKESQLESVMDEIDRRGFIPENLIEAETKVCYSPVHHGFHPYGWLLR